MDLILVVELSLYSCTDIKLTLPESDEVLAAV